MNGWNDHFATILNAAEFARYLEWDWPEGIRESAIPRPSETITFGEKKSGVFHVHMDFMRGDAAILEHARHGSHSRQGGGSNFAFADGSVRTLRYGSSVDPENLWAITPIWRDRPMEIDSF